MKITCDIVIVSRDTGAFSEFGKKGLPGLVLHVRESARRHPACQAIPLFLKTNSILPGLGSGPLSHMRSVRFLISISLWFILPATYWLVKIGSSVGKDSCARVPPIVSSNAMDGVRYLPIILRVF